MREIKNFSLTNDSGEYIHTANKIDLNKTNTFQFGELTAQTKL